VALGVAFLSYKNTLLKFEVLAVTSMKMAVLQNVVPCSVSE
jgi:hypothetical protein